MVEVRGNGFSPGPSGDSKIKTEMDGVNGIKRDFDFAGPGIIGFLRNPHRSLIEWESRAGGDKEVEVDRFVCVAVNILGKCSQETSDIGGTTGHRKPGATLVITRGSQGAVSYTHLTLPTTERV